MFRQKSPICLQTGFAQSLIVIILIIGMIAGIYLVQHQTNLLPKASTTTEHFTHLSATLEADLATFNFYAAENSSNYQIDVSTYPDMSWDTYLDFAPGHGSPITLTKPQAKWSKYQCGQTLYWRINDAFRAYSSAIQAAQVVCNQ